MQLSRTERWILSNQYRILEALYPKEAKSLAEDREAIENGYVSHYSWMSQHIYDESDGMSEEESSFVVNVLDMYSALKRAPLPQGVQPRQVAFPGFDGNNETKFMAYARYFCDSDGGRFGDLDRGDDFNSHMRSLDRYARQLEAWNQSEDKYQLSADDVARILAAARQPSS